MSAVVADTHALVWYLADSVRLSPAAKAAMDGALSSGDRIFVSGMTLIELAYLSEKGRISPALVDRVRHWLSSPDSGLEEVPVDSSLIPHLRLISREHVREMPDRIIAATALKLGIPLVSRDLEIRRSPVQVIW